MNESLVAKFFVGSGAPLAALAISHSTLNAWLQTTSLTIGIIVGVLTAISIIRGGLKK